MHPPHLRITTKIINVIVLKNVPKTVKKETKKQKTANALTAIAKKVKTQKRVAKNVNLKPKKLNSKKLEPVSPISADYWSERLV